MFLLFAANTNAATAIPSQAWSRDINGGGYIDGAPIGGFGAGTLSWTFAGDFYQGRLNIANSTFTTDANCHFYMYQKLSGQTAVMKMLNATTLGSGQATYYSLFPKAWVDYYGTTFPLETKVTQFSPIIPNDYTHSSYPEGIYEWDVTNSQAVSCDFAVMLTFDNTFSGTSASVTTSGNNVGLILDRAAGNATNQTQGQFTLATQTGAGVSVTYESAASVGTLQTAFGTAGLLANTTGSNTIGGIAFKVTLAPGQSVKLPIVLSWDLPLAKPGTGALWYREYTRTYGKTGKASATIAFDALNNYATWESSIDTWQNSILTGNYPDWMKQMLFNELYYYFTGGTIWEAGQYGSTSFDSGPDLFSSLESYIYAFYGTSDVRFYGSWPLALLWPNIDKQEVKQFCDSVVTGSMGVPMPAAIGTCAHDIGSLNDVFTAWNDYTYRDSTTWKDLNSKLVLMVYRAWELGGKTDTTFLNYCWPAVQAAMTKVHSQCDATGLPISAGIDQTYDDLGLTGDTAYCGSLFLAACEAAADMATSEGNSALATTYNGWLATGKTNFESLLWDSTGGYYHIDTGSTAPTRIMSDQLCGQWYAKALGLPGVVTDAHAVSAWQKVHDNNWQKFDSGAHGVVNVMTSGGAIDTSYPQSQEAWVGVGWGAAAGMVQQGMVTQATDMGFSLYNSIWNLGQWWFRTPEAWQTGLSNMRAPYYMRANCLWAVKHAYDIAPNPCGALTCTPTPTFTATATPQAPSACASPVRRVNCAGGQYVSGGITWVADQAYAAGGWGYVSGTAAASITNGITGTTYPGLYQTERYGNPVEYKFTVPNGSYQVVLHFVEQYWTAANSRVFSVAINGNTVISNLDIFAQVGRYAAYDRTFVIPVNTGLIDIVETATTDNAEITGIDILDNSVLCSPTPSPTGSTPTFTRTPTPSPTPSPTVTSTQTMTPTASSSSTATRTSTSTGTSSPSSTPTNTLTFTASGTFTPTLTPTSSMTFTSTATKTYTSTLTPSPTNTLSPTVTPTFTNTNVITSTPTNSPTVTMTPTFSSTQTASGTASPTVTKTGTSTASTTATPSPSLTASPSATSTKTTTMTATSTATVSPTSTNTNVITPTPTSTQTMTRSSTPSSTASKTPSSSPTSTFSMTPTRTSTPTLTPSRTSTPSWTFTPSNSSTFTPTFSSTSTFTSTPTFTPLALATFTPTPFSSQVLAEPPFPNPDLEGSPVVIDIQGPGSLDVHWSVFTTAFRKVREGDDAINGQGSVVWDLKDRSGAAVARGLYYLRVDIRSAEGSTKKTFKILVLH